MSTPIGKFLDHLQDCIASEEAEKSYRALDIAWVCIKEYYCFITQLWNNIIFYLICLVKINLS